MSEAKFSIPTVWKFPVPFPGPDVFEIEMPQHAEVLTVQVQHGELQMWAYCNPSFALVPRHFRIAGTGHPITDEIQKYVSTFQIAGGILVFHVFEVHS